MGGGPFVARFPCRPSTCGASLPKERFHGVYGALRATAGTPPARGDKVRCWLPAPQVCSHLLAPRIRVGGLPQRLCLRRLGFGPKKKSTRRCAIVGAAHRSPKAGRAALAGAPDGSRTLLAGLNALRAEVMVCTQEMGAIISRVHASPDKERVYPQPRVVLGWCCVCQPALLSASRRNDPLASLERPQGSREHK